MSLFTKLPRWATGAGASIVEPTETKKNNGWIASEKPPAEYENWKWKTLHDCLVVMDGLQSLPLTWAARHTFNGGITVPTPTAATDAATKQYVDDHVTDAAGAHAASAIANTPAGTIAATTVQAALNELDTEKAALAGASFTGAVSVPTPTAAAHAARKNMGGATLENLGTPSASTDAASKGYVDSGSVSGCVVAGRVRGNDGAILQQKGSVTASCTHDNTGRYTVTIPGLTTSGIVLAEVHRSAGAGLTSHNTNIASGSFSIAICSISGSNYEDDDFSFVVLKL